MRNILTIFLVVISLISVAQNRTEKRDSVKHYKNEFGLNLIPSVILLSNNNNYRSRIAINYRRYLDQKNILRISLGVYPLLGGPYFDVYPAYYTKTDTFNIYRNTEHKNGPTPQINLGYERVLRKKHLIHSVGAEIYLNYQHSETKEKYYWAGQNTNVPQGNWSGISNNKIDSLGYSQTSDKISVGIHPFYNLRIPVLKHWLISATIGPNMAVVKAKVSNTTNKTGQTVRGNVTNIDFNACLLSDLSLVFRF